MHRMPYLTHWIGVRSLKNNFTHFDNRLFGTVKTVCVILNDIIFSAIFFVFCKGKIVCFPNKILFKPSCRSEISYYFKVKNRLKAK